MQYKVLKFVYFDRNFADKLIIIILEDFID